MNDLRERRCVPSVIVASGLLFMFAVAAPLAARDVVVTEFGARGDGKSDDAESIHRAITAAAKSAGSRVVFPPSAHAYVVRKTILVAADNIELFGPGATLRLGDGAGSGGRVHLLAVSGAPDKAVKNVIVRGLTLDANYFAQKLAYRPRALKVTHATRVLIDRVSIRRAWVGMTFGLGTVDAEARDCVVTDWDNDGFSATGDERTAGCRNIRFVRCRAVGAPALERGGRSGQRNNAWEIEDGATQVRLVECVVDRCGGNAFAVRSHAIGKHTLSDVEFFRCQARRVDGFGWFVRGTNAAVRVSNVRLRDCLSLRPTCFFRGVDAVSIQGCRFEGATGIGFHRGTVEAEARRRELRDAALPVRRLEVSASQVSELVLNGLPGLEGGVRYAPAIQLRQVGSARQPVVHGSAAQEQVQVQVRELGPLPPRLRWNYHAARPGRPFYGEQDALLMLSPLIFDSGAAVRTTREWYAVRRPELLRHWRGVLGKLVPAGPDRRWLGDVRATRRGAVEKRDGYERVEIEIPLETDFHQKYVLLLPAGQGKGPFPAVIAWTSTSPDYRQPEAWWGAWLARRGYVVLCGWSFIRHYRGETSYRNRVNERIYERYGHWLPMAVMAHHAQREAEYLRTLPQVDGARIGFMGFSLSAKAALYVGAFVPEITATVAIDPHIALNGGTNYHDPWYLDWNRSFPTRDSESATVLSRLDADPTRPGLERNHHELLALTAPRAFLLIGCSLDREDGATHSDDRQSWSYYNRAREVYDLLGIGPRLEFVGVTSGHRATGPRIDAAWRGFFTRWLKEEPIRFAGYEGEYGEDKKGGK